MVRCVAVVAVVTAVSANPTAKEDALSLLQLGAHRPAKIEARPSKLMSVSTCDCDPPCICEDGTAKTGVAYDTLDTSPTAFNQTSKSCTKEDPSEMKDFIRATIIQKGGKIVNDYGISVLAPYFCPPNADTLDDLSQNIINPEWTSYWTLPGVQGSVAIETDKEVTSVQKKKKKPHKKTKAVEASPAPPAPELLADKPVDNKPQLAEESAAKEPAAEEPAAKEPAAEEPAANVLAAEQPAEQSATEQPSVQTNAGTEAAPTLSPDVSLDQAGYEKIAALKDTTMMAEFIKHVVWKEGGKLKDEQPLQWFSKYHSGEKSTQNFKLLDAQLRKSNWIEGMPAPGNAGAPVANAPQQQ